MKYFAFSTFFALMGLVVAFVFLGGFEAAYIVFLLALLEVSISFDNAVINAKVLDGMDAKWRNRFIVYGIPIAVFGVRFILPILIVALASSRGFLEITQLALDDAQAYAALLQGVMGQIYAFGGAFLLMVFLEFFFDSEREITWISVLESHKLVHKMSRFAFIELLFAAIIGIILFAFSMDMSIGIAYFIGLALYAGIRGIDKALVKTGAKSGMVGFLYLEILDASFSLDGVIGAFALSNNVFIIMIGLAIGAFYVRSLTIYFVEKKTLSEFIYLEHGARYAIFFLAVLMFIQIFQHIPESIIGSIGILIIAIAFVHSLLDKKRFKE